MNKARTTKPFLKLAAYMLSAAVILLPVGSAMHAEAETDAVDIWSAYATEKILQGAESSSDAVRSEPKVAVHACKGEYESTQLILTANKDISSYNVEVSDLTDGAGNTFKAENILVYHEKYIEVKATFEGNGAETGMYPDALLPIEKAVEYGENTISAGNNQGVYITFNVPADQAAGTYTGTLKVTYDGAQASVPVTLGVNDILVSQTTHTQSKFNVTFAHWLGELNSTQDMLDSYISVMAEHRISPGLIMFGNDSNYNDESIAAYAQKAYDLLQANPKMSTFAVPTPTMTDSSTGLPTLNGEIFGKYLNAIVDVALASYDAKTQTGFDLMSYAICTVSIIDEPDLNNTLNRVPGVAAQFEGAISGAKAYLETQAAAKGVSDAFVQEIETSLDNFPLIVSLTTTWTPDEETQSIITACPLISLYDSASQREVYAQQEQRWIYTCNQPHSPYPTYHIDDTLVSARSLSWMMSESISPSTTITARRSVMKMPTATATSCIRARPTAWTSRSPRCASKPFATAWRNTNSGTPCMMRMRRRGILTRTSSARSLPSSIRAQRSSPHPSGCSLRARRSSAFWNLPKARFPSASPMLKRTALP